MLSRALRPRLQQSTVRAKGQQSAEGLTLPWLSPAARRRNARIALDSRQKPQASRPTPRLEARSLATAAPTTAAASTAPFQGLAQAWSRLPDPQLHKLQPIDPSKPLIVHDAFSSVAMPNTPIKFGIGGDPIELHQNLYACLRVGRLDRATAILKRLSDMYESTAPEMVDAHNSYLQAMYEQAEPEPTAANMAAIKEWYQENMVQRGIQPNAQTFVTLLRAALSHPDARSRSRLARGYLKQVAEEHGAQALEDVNASPDFSDEQWDALIRLQSDAYEAPPSVDQVREAQLATPDKIRTAIEHGFVPEPAVAIKPVKQKGLGLQTLKASLALFDPTSCEGEMAIPESLDASPEERDRLRDYTRQIRLEQDAHAAAVARWKAEEEKLKEVGIHPVMQSKPVQALMHEWFAAVVPRLEAEIKKTKEVLNNPSVDTQTDLRHRYGPYLEDVDPKNAAALALSRLCIGIAANATRGQQSGPGTMKLTAFAQAIGRDIEEQVNMTSKRRHQSLVRSLRKKTREELLRQLARYKTPDTANAGLEASDEEIKKRITSNTFLQREFPPEARLHIGVLVLEMIMQTAMLTVVREDPKTGKTVQAKQPAFSFYSAFTHGKKIVYIMAHHELVSKLHKEPVADVQFGHLPMLATPKPWTSFEDGGYYTLGNQVVRTKAGDFAQKSYAKVAIENGDMKKVLAGLDVLGKVPWKINKDVFNVMSEVWNKDLGLAKIVPENDTLELPQEPGPDASSKEKVRYLVRMKDYQNAKGGLHSQRCFQNFQLELARAYLNEKFYYPHSVDFRGRAYPIPPVLNHIGSDIARGLLMFYNGKELGEVGLRWMKVQLANLYGFDKASLRDREQFAMDHMEDIIDSANNPLDGRRWWLGAEDPWQCLAACIELRNAWALPDPTRYVSNLPVHQDGTCNGLQHYAALGGDEAGASQVNLEPSDKPQDIYTGVAEIVKELVAEDAKKGSRLAQHLDGKITRQVVKRTVMTNVYGVTFIGAKAQVESELRNIFTDRDPDGPSIASLALYTVRHIFGALGRIFNGAQEIQVWLGECGDRITTSLSAEQIQKIREYYDGGQITLDPKYKQEKGKTIVKKTTVTKTIKKKIEKDMETFKTAIIWTTPLKMPVVQPYRKDAVQIIKTAAGAITVARSTNVEAVNKRKQLQAFPPNFIHSLDATHMMLSALKCSELGMDFAAVHDSFWTHAADIPKLNTVLRDAFVRMHSEDIMGRLAAEFKARYAGAMFQAKIWPTSAVAKEIHVWRREHKWNINSAHYKELALESQRQEYLNSEDPELRKKGEEMVTPTSIWLKHADPSSLSSERLALLGDAGGRGNKKPREIQRKMQEAEREALKSENGAVSVASIDVENEAMAANEEGLTEADTEEVDEGALDEVDADADAEVEVEAGAAEEKTGGTYCKNVTKVWLPLTFPPVPKRGSWDVRRLHESKYFFS